MHVVMVGAGYVGLVSGACFAEFGADVTCVDVNQERVDALQSGEIPIYEPGLDQLVATNVAAGRLKFSTKLSEVVPSADLVFIAVGTPTRRGDGHADLTYVYAAAKEIAQHIQGYTVIVDKSTVPVGTARQVRRIIKEENSEADFDVASNTEFLREGAAISDFLATKISFINEISALCEKVGADVHSVAKGMGMDGRIGRKFLHAGPGYGGSCFPKDTLALVRIAQEHDASMRIVESVVEVNAAQKARMVKKIRNALGGSESGKTIAVLGLTFKPETDDMRDSPSLAIIPPLLDKGAVIHAHDPQGMEEAKSLLPSSVNYFSDLYKACEGADAVVIMTEWNAYRGLDLAKVLKLMKGNAFVDLRNVYENESARKAGFDYHSVGR